MSIGGTQIKLASNIDSKCVHSSGCSYSKFNTKFTRFKERMIMLRASANRYEDAAS